MRHIPPFFLSYFDYTMTRPVQLMNQNLKQWQ
ncbi:hypothetical protein AAZX31_13G211200 [Glycine max]